MDDVIDRCWRLSPLAETCYDLMANQEYDKQKGAAFYFDFILQHEGVCSPLHFITNAEVAEKEGLFPLAHMLLDRAVSMPHASGDSIFVQQAYAQMFPLAPKLLGSYCFNRNLSEIALLHETPEAFGAFVCYAKMCLEWAQAKPAAKMKKKNKAKLLALQSDALTDTLCLLDDVAGGFSLSALCFAEPFLKNTADGLIADRFDAAAKRYLLDDAVPRDRKTAFILEAVSVCAPFDGVLPFSDKLENNINVHFSGLIERFAREDPYAAMTLFSKSILFMMDLQGGLHVPRYLHSTFQEKNAYFVVTQKQAYDVICTDLRDRAEGSLGRGFNFMRNEQKLLI